MDIYLETERMVLRRLTEDDAPLLIELDSDPEVMRFLTDGVPTPEADIRERILPGMLSGYAEHPGFGLWVALEKSSGDFLGWFEFIPTRGRPADEPELGYRLRKEAWGNGYATEGSLALVRKGFTELAVRRVFAHTMIINARSRHVMEKVGLTVARTFVYGAAEPPPEGVEHDEIEYALERADWERLSGTAATS